jgi:hypothetical protein
VPSSSFPCAQAAAETRIRWVRVFPRQGECKGRESEVAGNAGVAASAAFASTAAIPYVGPELAPAAAGAAYAAAMAWLPVASAAGGFDIPAGLNPVTQLHQQEMVLPAHLANPLREQLSGAAAQACPTFTSTQWTART